MFFNPTPIGGGSERVGGATFGGMRPPRARPPIVRGGPVMSFKKGGKVKRTGLALVHKNETVIPAPSKKRSSISRTMGSGSKTRKKAKIKKTMGEWKKGTLHSGSKKGPKVTSQKQAVAIALSQSRREK